MFVMKRFDCMRMQNLSFQILQRKFEMSMALFYSKHLSLFLSVFRMNCIKFVLKNCIVHTRFCDVGLVFAINEKYYYKEWLLTVIEVSLYEILERFVIESHRIP